MEIALRNWNKNDGNFNTPVSKTLDFSDYYLRCRVYKEEPLKLYISECYKLVVNCTFWKARSGYCFNSFLRRSVEKGFVEYRDERLRGWQVAIVRAPLFGSSDRVCGWRLSRLCLYWWLGAAGQKYVIVRSRTPRGLGMSVRELPTPVLRAMAERTTLAIMRLICAKINWIRYASKPR